MLEYMLADIICQTFEKAPGRNQDLPCYSMGGPPEITSKQAMLIEMDIHIDSEKEEGYRHIDLLLYAPSNYVQVWTRERWDVIPLEDLEYDDDGDSYVKKGKDYTKGETEWTMLSDHDSCWRDAVQKLIFDNRHKLASFDGIGSWYKVIPLQIFPQLAELYKAERKKRGYSV